MSADGVKQLDSMFQTITGMSIRELADRKFRQGQSDEEITRQIGENIRRDHEAHDVLKNAVKEMVHGEETDRR